MIIMSSFTIYFGKDELSLLEHLKAQPKPSAYLKKLIEKDMVQHQDLYSRIFGDIEKDYGSMKRFIQECGTEAIKSRLQSCGEAQREHLIEQLKAKHKELKDL